MSRGPEDDRSLTDLDRTLARVRFTPRASLGPELVGRARTALAGLPRRMEWWRRTLGLASAVMLLGVGGLGVRSLLLGPAHLLTVDRCCQDLDGDGPADDGLLVVSDGGEGVRSLSIYEDQNHNGHYTPGDPIRFHRDGGDAGLAAPSGPMSTRAFCCADYDGGGLEDDGLIVVAHDPGDIAMAAIFEAGSAVKRRQLR